MYCLASIVWIRSGLTQSFLHSHEILTFTQIPEKFNSGYILHRHTLAARVYINYKKSTTVILTIRNVFAATCIKY